jgi:hypothetical protein
MFSAIGIDASASLLNIKKASQKAASLFKAMLPTLLLEKDDVHVPQPNTLSGFQLERQSHSNYMLY